MGLKRIHIEVIKFIGLRIVLLDDLYDHISGSKEFSKIGINQINFSEAMAKLERLNYIKEPELQKDRSYELTADGVKIYLKMLEKRK